MTTPAPSASEPFALTLRQHDGTTHRHREASWDPAQTAIVVCDFWDSHHSVTAVRRVDELAPRLDAVLKAARARGATIIHAPSDCMPAYADHPARQAALAAPEASGAPPAIEAWCHRIPSEEAAAYPIDQSDGGEDETEWEDARWTAVLEGQGRNPGTPWLAQNAGLEIADTDFIAAEGDVVWNVLESRGIKHVILAGVHTNMCVLGRPFGLRNMVRGGMDTVLMRDMTDVMYNPARWPYVSHFTGLDLVVRHIEGFVCPSITSDQIVGGEPFRFKGDARPHVEIVVDPAWQLDELKRFARRYLDPSCRVSYAAAAAPAGGKAAAPDTRLCASGGRSPGAATPDPVPAVVVGGGLAKGRSLSPAGARRAAVGPPAFGDPAFDRHVFEAILWATGQDAAATPPEDPDARRAAEGWHPLGPAPGDARYRDLRTLLRAPADLVSDDRTLRCPAEAVFVNGEGLASAGEGVWTIPAGTLRPGDLNLLVVRTTSPATPLAALSGGADGAPLSAGHWQVRHSNDESPDTGFPIPPQFGAPTDLIQDWPAAAP